MLTPREYEVVQLLALGMTNREIASQAGHQRKDSQEPCPACAGEGRRLVATQACRAGRPAGPISAASVALRDGRDDADSIPLRRAHQGAAGPQDGSRSVSRNPVLCMYGAYVILCAPSLEDFLLRETAGADYHRIFQSRAGRRSMFPFG